MFGVLRFVKARITAELVDNLKRPDNLAATIRDGHNEYGFCNVARFLVDFGVKIRMIIRVIRQDCAVFGKCLPDESRLVAYDDLSCSCIEALHYIENVI